MPVPSLSPLWRVVLLGVDLAVVIGVILLLPYPLGFGAGAVSPLVPVVAAAGVLLLARTIAAGRPVARGLVATVAAAGAVALALLLGAPGGGWLLVPVAGLSAGLAVALAHGLAAAAGRDHGRRRAVLVGPLACRCRLREHLAAHPETGLVVVAEVGPDGGAPNDVPVVPLDELEQAVVTHAADEVLLSTGFDDRVLLTKAMAKLLERPLIVRFIPDPEALPLFCPRPADLAGMPAIDLSRGPLSPNAELAKWMEDKLVALAALAVAGLPMLLVAVAIKLTSPGPVLFVQERHGRYGRIIRVFKFRTMRSDAAGGEVTTGSFRQAAKGDPRITRLGRFLRNTSLDELPQFLNVLRGDMSVVGPRPHVPALNRRFASEIGEMMRRHYVKPGITGLAQISGARGETRTAEDMRRRVNYDLEYLRSWSLWLDLRIIAYTVLFGWFNKHP